MFPAIVSHAELQSEWRQRAARIHEFSFSHVSAAQLYAGSIPLQQR